MNYTIIFATALLIFSLASCDPRSKEIEIPQAETKLVISSLQVNENLLVVSVSQSFSALRSDYSTKSVFDSLSLPIPQDLLVENAIVTLHGPHGMTSLKPLYKGIYYTETIHSLPYANYEIRVSHPESGLYASSQVTAMPCVKFESVTLQRDVKGVLQLNCIIHDPIEIENYYVLNYLHKSKNDTIPDDITDVNYIAERLMNQSLNFDLISDALASEGKIIYNRSITANDLDSMGVSITNISKEYFDYLIRLKRSKALVNQIKGEVINLTGNVKNGYGFFTMNIPDVVLLQLNR
jgi:hypothetical protein